MRRLESWSLCLALGLATCFGQQAVAQQKDIVDTAVGAGSFKTLAAALQAAGLVDALKGEGPFTVFAPTDEAFSKLPKGTVETLLKPENKKKLTAVLTYHVAKGKAPAEKVVELNGVRTLNGQQVDIRVEENRVKLDQANVVKTDIQCSNGIIHVIDRVLLPASDDLVTTATKAEKFSTLLAAVKAAGLVEAVSGEEPLTIFAPTDEAFAKLPEGTVASLLKPENKEKLVAILKYHVVPGRVYSSDALKAKEAETLQGGSVSITADDQGARVNDAKLLATDIDASNGVIHVIDSVLLPSNQGESAATPRQMIEQAIAQGVPMYNSGHAEACAAVYMTTVRDLIAMETAMPASTTQTLQTAVHTAEHSHCSDSQAWTLRHALDVAYHSMPARPVR